MGMEFALRLVLPQDKLLVRPCTDPDEDLGMVNSPDCHYFDERMKPIYAYHVSQNNLGARMPKDIELDSPRHRILIMGDSFTFGPYLSSYDTMTIWHMRDLASGKRTRIKGSDIRYLHVP